MVLFKKCNALHFFMVSSLWMPLTSHAEDKSRYEQRTDYILNAINSLNLLNSRRDCAPLTPPVSETQKWAAAGFGDPQITSINLSPANALNKTFTHKLNLSLVMFRNTGWTSELIQTHLRQVGEIYAQCGIALGTAKLVIVNPPNNWIDITLSRDNQIAEMTPNMSKPTLYFVRSSQEGDAAYAWNKDNCDNESRCDTAWITNDVNAPSRRQLFSDKYNSVAHELAHILGNCDHVTDGSANLLGNTVDKLNGTILPQQCNEFKKHKSVRKL